MTGNSDHWAACLGRLHDAPLDSFEHRLGDALTGLDTAGALSLLIEVVTEDPSGTPEYATAGHLIHELTAVAS